MLLPRRGFAPRPGSLPSSWCRCALLASRPCHPFAIRSSWIALAGSAASATVLDRAGGRRAWSAALALALPRLLHHAVPSHRRRPIRGHPLALTTVRRVESRAMAPSDNTRSRAASPAHWACDFCERGAFRDYRDAIEHERGCEERSAELTLPAEEGKRLGLTLLDEVVSEGGKLRPFVTISGKSPVFELLRVRAAANALFSVDASFWAKCYDALDHCVGGEDSVDDSDTDDDDDGESDDRWNNLQSLIEFGQKNLHHILNIIESSPCNRCNFFNINSGFLKAFLAGRLQPGSFLQKVECTESGTSGTKSIPLVSSIGAAAVLRERHRYPLKITLARRLDTQSKLDAQHSLPAHLEHPIENPLVGIQKLDLSNNGLVDEGYGPRHWGHLYNGLNRMHTLKGLNLDMNKIGIYGCTILAKLLKKRGSSLSCLSLKKTSVDDKCIAILAEALRENSTLVTLDVDKNGDITATGWNSILDLLCDKRSIESTFGSNHTLKQLGVNFYALGRSSRPGLGSIVRQVRDAVSFNRCPMHPPARRKIWNVHFEGDDFARKLTDVSAKLMPRALAWFARGSEPGRRIRLNAICRVLRDWNAAELFGFPSAERTRIGSRAADLETKNAELEALVAKVMAENRRMKETNRDLRGNIQALKRRGGALAPSPLRCSRRVRRS